LEGAPEAPSLDDFVMESERKVMNEGEERKICCCKNRRKCSNKKELSTEKIRWNLLRTNVLIHVRMDAS
jgi:hypothetical protein